MNPLTPEETPQAKAAVEREDSFALAAVADQDTISRLKTAEELFALRQQRITRSRLAVAAQTAVGFVAIAGFFANAYQVFMSTRQQHAQMENEQQRWRQEFDRSREADKYRAFFDTSALATDTANANKRLVGYALLQEFVADPEYNSKATLMLQEALAQELKRNTEPGLVDDARTAVLAILHAIAETKDCGALNKAAQSIDTVGKRLTETDDGAEAKEVFGIYVRRLIGRAAMVCKSGDDFRGVRRPLRDVLIRLPALAGAKPPLSAAKANAVIAATLVAMCTEEQQVSGSSDCAEIRDGYLKLCPDLLAEGKGPYESASCNLMQAMPIVPAPESDGGVPASAEAKDAGVDAG